MNIRVLSRIKFKEMMKSNNIDSSNVGDYKDTFFICINNTFEDKLPLLKEGDNVKVMFFDDVYEDQEEYTFETKKYTRKKAFTVEQARELFDFIIKHKDRKYCFVHCEGGMSRSGAVGAFISDFTGGNYFQFLQQNPQIHENNLVIRLLKEQFSNYENFFDI